MTHKHRLADAFRTVANTSLAVAVERGSNPQRRSRFSTRPTKGAQKNLSGDSVCDGSSDMELGPRVLITTTGDWNWVAVYWRRARYQARSDPADQRDA